MRSTKHPFRNPIVFTALIVPAALVVAGLSYALTAVLFA